MFRKRRKESDGKTRNESIQYTRDDLILEFQLEVTRCQSYSDLLYKAIQFTFVAVIALVAAAVPGEEVGKSTVFILMICIPICVCVFGVLYAYNMYALGICGTRAEKIHQKIYSFEGQNSVGGQMKSQEEDPFSGVLTGYVISKKYLTVIAYSAMLLFFIAVPEISFMFGRKLDVQYGLHVIGCYLEKTVFIGLLVYMAIMMLIVAAIIGSYIRGKNDENIQTADAASTAADE